MKSIKSILLFLLIVLIALSESVYHKNENIDVPPAAAAPVINNNNERSRRCFATCPLGINTSVHPHFTDCQRYLECQNGFMFDYACPDGTIFDVETLQCREVGRCLLDRRLR